MDTDIKVECVVDEEVTDEEAHTTSEPNLDDPDLQVDIVGRMVVSETGVQVRRYFCQVCKKSFARTDKLRAHLRNVHHLSSPSLKLLSCPHCDKLCTSQRLLTLHLNEHKQKRLPCPVCEKTFASRAQLDKHEVVKHGRQFECGVCGQKVNRQSKLDNHMKQHNGYPCSSCDETCPTWRELRTHKLSHRSELLAAAERKKSQKTKRAHKPKSFGCPSCSMRYTTQDNLDSHMRNGHAPNGYTCEHCGVNFDSKLKLKIHSYKHKAKLCGICGLWVSSNLGAHMTAHEGHKAFQCAVAECGKSFLRNCDLTIHTRTHTGEKPFACDYANCNMRFTRRSKMVVHRRTHTGEKPYKCEFENCSQSFAQPFDLTLHMRRHTGEKPYECDRCGERFILTYILKKHQQTCNK